MNGGGLPAWLSTALSTWLSTWGEAAGLHGHGWSDVAALFGQFALLSLLGFGGAISTAPEMRRFLVDARGWMGGQQFTDSIAIAQAAPGPNVLFIAVLGWGTAGLAGALATMTGILLPSTIVALAYGRVGRRYAKRRGVRAFGAGLVPLTVGLMVASGWLLALPFVERALHAQADAAVWRSDAPALALVALATLATTRGWSRPLVWIGLGALLGVVGLV